MANKQVLHKRSSVINTDGSPKLPDATKIDYGELAINYADTAEVLSIKNSNNAIIPFIPKRAFIEAPIVDSVDYLIGVKGNELIRISPSDIGVVTYTYSTPEITLTYGTADNTASTVSPTLSYTQVKTGSDGTTETITGSLENPNGATITFSISSSESDVSIDSSTGVVSFKANSSDSARTLGTVNVTVVWNEESGSGTATVYQEGATVATGEAGDICFYDSNTNSKVIVAYDTWNASPSSYPSSRFTPIGVVAIPSSHDVYGTGQCGVMSLVPMSYSTPDIGATEETTMYWGQYQVDTSLTNYTQVIYNSNASASSFSSYTSLGSTCYLPSDMFSGSVCGTDSSAHYYGTTSYYLPSPYASDGSANSYYSQGGTSNVLSDFDGVSNTQVLIDLATAQSDWKTASTITNNSGSGYSPAACCCWRYDTSGTSQGDWYLPAMGELGYMMVRLNKLNTTINSMNSSYGVGVALASSGYYWSSSEYSSSNAVYVFTFNGNVYYYNKTNRDHVRAFLRV